MEEIEGPAEEVADLLLQLKDPLASIFDTLCWKGLESWKDLIATAVDATAEQVSLQCRYQKLTEGSAE